MKPLLKEEYLEIVRAALKEDIGDGDISTACLNLDGRRAKAIITAKEDGVIAGLKVAADVFVELDPAASIDFKVEDGQLVRKGMALMEITGLAAALLTAERTALNFLQRLSGIATFTFRMARQVKGTNAKIYDTRKTTPGLRLLEKYAVRTGGGTNHRTGLYDGVLLKDNHILLAGGITNAIRAARERAGDGMLVEVETSNMEQVREALEAGADRIMLDNMDLIQMDEAVKLIDGRAEVEASGNVDMLIVGSIAGLGVDIISVGAITHSADSMDIAMYFHPDDKPA